MKNRYSNMNLINNIILDDTVIPCTVRIMYTRNSRNKYVGGGRKKRRKKEEKKWWWGEREKNNNNTWIRRGDNNYHTDTPVRQNKEDDL